MNKSLKIIQNLIHNENYTRKVLPFLKSEYFVDNAENIIFTEVKSFVEKYNAMPTIEALVLTINDKKNISEDAYNNISSKMGYLKQKPEDNTDWLVGFTEEFCKKQSLDNALVQAIAIREGTEKKLTTDAIPGILQDALSVSFDLKVGHDYFENYVERYEYYTRKELKVPFDIDVFNEVTKGGLSDKTLTILIAGPNVGKTATMCHLAASNLLSGKNVLYVTAEMSEEEISKRIDANLFDVNADMLETLPLTYFENKINSLKALTQGKLIVKEYATGAASAVSIQQLLNELNLKKSFVPDIIYIDYMNIFMSARLKASADKSYGVVKSISEEFRSLGVVNNIPIVTATQFNRGGHANSDPSEGDIADSFGPIMTADLVWALIRNEELARAGQMMIKQLKSRYMDKNRKPKFFVGFNPDRGKLTNVANTSEENGEDHEAAGVFDSTDFGNAVAQESFNKIRKGRNGNSPLKINF